jgi:predicted nucleic acid-binding protein
MDPAGPVSAPICQNEMNCMTDRLFVDTNVLIYAMDPENPGRRAAAADVIRKGCAAQRLILSPQILNECYRTLVHKRKLVPASQARDYLRPFLALCTAPLDADTHRIAYAIEDRHRLSWWDCVVLASSLQAGCRYFISEDMQDGQTVESITIVNPFEPASRSRLRLN